MSAPGTCRIYLSAGEASGDAHAAHLARAIWHATPRAVIEATGGAALAAAGATIRHDIAPLGAMGLVEAARTLPAHVRVLRDLTRRFQAGAYDLLVVVDYPGFHVRLAEAAQRAGVPTLFYVAPQLWAWGAHRAARLAAAARRLAVILPFEERFFRARGVAATFVGHPLLDTAPTASRTAARAHAGLPPPTPLLGLFPGSRASEVQRLWPVMRDAAHEARRASPGLSVAVAAVPACAYPGLDGILLWPGTPRSLMAAADAGLCKSGTTTLEAALAGLPMVVAYRMHPLTFAVARRVVRVPWISLVNLVAGHDIVPELVQDQASATTLAAAVLPLLDRGGSPARRQREGFARVRARLGAPGASRRVAAMALEMVA